jgi:hypothetical protein
MTLALATALILIVALALDWNNPRPGRPPDWQAPDLPLRLEASADQVTVLLLNHPGGDFTFEAEAIPLSGPELNGYGLVYRAQDAAHYYTFAVGSDGYYAVLRVEGDEKTFLVDWQQFPHIRRGRQPNRLRLTCMGSTCRFFINDEYAATVEDSTWLMGYVGLWARGFENESVVVQFVNARVWAGDMGLQRPPGLGPQYRLAPHQRLVQRRQQTRLILRQRTRQRQVI